jgi:hypothetical protein
MSRGELERASGLAPEQLKELETYGLVSPDAGPDGESRYDEVDLECAKLCRELLKLPGVEPRHLRIFRMSADRFAALADQVAMPYVKQRNPEARRQAADMVRELVRVGDRLVLALLRDGLKSYHA